MYLRILSPSKIIFDGEVEFVALPGELGELGVLRNHAPLVSELKEGKIKVRGTGQENIYPIRGGFVEILHNRITVLIGEE